MANERHVDSIKKGRMDGETAIAFAIERFQETHQQDLCPDWLSRCTTIGYRKDERGHFVVSFAVTPIATNDAVCYFKVSVDPVSAETVVLRDNSFAEFVGEELYGF